MNPLTSRPVRAIATMAWGARKFVAAAVLFGGAVFAGTEAQASCDCEIAGYCYSRGWRVCSPDANERVVCACNAGACGWEFFSTCS